MLNVRFRDRLMNRAMTGVGSKAAVLRRRRPSGTGAKSPGRAGGPPPVGAGGLNYLPMEGIRGLLQAAPQLVFLMPDKPG